VPLTGVEVRVLSSALQKALHLQGFLLWLNSKRTIQRTIQVGIAGVDPDV
jgi:hypothetical protein